MNIGFVFTNYNNSLFTREAVYSIFVNKEWGNCHIVIVDNKSNENNIDQLIKIKDDYQNIHLILNCNNVGYFKGLNIGIKYLRNKEENIDHIIIGNNDLYFPNNFISSIYRKLDILELHAVIAPNIINADGVHQNPHVIKKISKFREIIYDLYYSNYYISEIIAEIAEITKIFSERKDSKQYEKAQIIYQGYGACYILGPIFFRYFGSLWAPTFLMGEEYFLSKQLESRNLSIYYEPSIVMNHHYHAAINMVSRKKLWELSRQSHKVYRKYNNIWK